MVKRPKSPEVTEDARYFTVYQPYPINANWILEDEQKRCAMWVAECIGLNMLWAIHYKPRARGMILLEVSKTFTDHGRLLGEHRWPDILKEPDELEKRSVTQVFHSFYTRLRDCQKDGWKTITVQTIWFKDWRPGKGNIKQPYPSTHWCDTPGEDKTNKPLCRPIPNETRTVPISLPPPRPLPPVVGSSKWVATQSEAPPTPSEVTDAWDKKLPSLEIPAVNALAQEKLSTRSPSPGVSSPWSAGPVSNASTTSGNKFPVTKGSRAKPVPLNSFISGDKKTGKNTWANPPPSAKFSVTDPVSVPPVNAWTRKLNIAPAEKEPKVTTPAPYETKMDHSGWGSAAPVPERASTPASPAVTQSSGPPDEPPPYKSNKGKGKQKNNGRQADEQHRKERRPGDESFDPRGGKADRKPPNRNAKPDPPPPVDWSMEPLPSNDWNKPLDMEVDMKNDAPSLNDWNKPLDMDVDTKNGPPHPSSSSSSFLPSSSSSSSSSFSNDKKRKPDGQFNKDGEPQYDKYGEPSNRKSDSVSSSTRDRDSFTTSDRGRGRGRKEERGRGRGRGERGRGRGRGRGGGGGGGGGGGDGWDSRSSREGQEPRDWESGVTRSSSRASTQGDRDNNFKRSSYRDESKSRSKNWDDHRSFNDTNKSSKSKDDYNDANVFGPIPGTSWGDMPLSPIGKHGEKEKDENIFGPIPGTSWGDMPLSPKGKDAEKEKESDENPFGSIPGTSWGDLPLSPVDKSTKKLDWAEDVDAAMDVERKKEGEEGFTNPDTHEEPPPSDDMGGEEGNEHETADGGPNAVSSSSGNAVPETRGPNDWGQAPGKDKVKSWGDDLTEEDNNPFGRPPDDSAWAAISAKDFKPKPATNVLDDNPFGRPPDDSAWAAYSGKGSKKASKPKPSAKKRDDSDNPFGRPPDDSAWTALAGKGSKPKPAAKKAEDDDNPFGRPPDDSAWAALSGKTSKPKPAAKKAEDPFGQQDDSAWAAYAGMASGSAAKEPSDLDIPWDQPPDASAWARAGDKPFDIEDENPWARPADYSGWIPEGKEPYPLPEWDSILEESLRSKRPEPEDLICPTHNIACRKGICSDMAVLIRKRNMDQWMAKRGRGGRHGTGRRGRGKGDPRGPKGPVGAKELPNGEIVTYKKTRRGNKKAMKGFDDADPAPTDSVAATEAEAADDDTNAGHVNDYQSDSDDGQ